MGGHARTFEDEVAFLRKDEERRCVMHVGKGFVPNMNVAGERVFYKKNGVGTSYLKVWCQCVVSYTKKQPSHEENEPKPCCAPVRKPCYILVTTASYP